MRIVILTFIVGLFSACGWHEPFDAARTCEFGEGFGTWHEQKDRGCAFYKAEAEAARDTLLAQGRTTPDQIRAVIAVEVWVHDDTPEIICQGQYGQAGCYEFGGAIETSTGGGEIFHEYMHRIDELNGVAEDVSAAHTGWGDDGRMAAGFKFQGNWNGYAADALGLFGHTCEKGEPGCDD